MEKHPGSATLYSPQKLLLVRTILRFVVEVQCTMYNLQPVPCVKVWTPERGDLPGVSPSGGHGHARLGLDPGPGRPVHGRPHRGQPGEHPRRGDTADSLSGGLL
jgi:hypothetical protein